MTTERRLPTAYTRALAMAADVWAGAPEPVDRRMPHVPHAGRGVQIRRKGYIAKFRRRDDGPVNGPELDHDDH